MKKHFLFALLFVVSSAFLTAQAESDIGLKISIAESMEEFSRAYIAKHPDLVSMQGLAVMTIENDSENAARAKIGELIRAYLEEAVTRSMIFVLTDRTNLDRILDEIKFSAAGMVSDDTAVQIGEITGTSVLVSGSVAEEGSNFQVLLRLSEIESGEILTVHRFSLPQSDLIEASTELKYSYVAANGIGLTAKMLSYIYGAETFNKWNPVYVDITAKYRLSRDWMISGGVITNLVGTGENYRWDPSMYTDQQEILYSDIQPDLPDTFNTGGDAVGQITGQLTSTVIPHLDFQYTINFSPSFNIGINAGVVGYINPEMEVRYGSHGDLFFNNQEYDDTGAEGAVTAQKDTMPMTYVFESTVGGKIELCPEVFITNRIAVTGVAGYMYIPPAVLRSVFASEGDWEYYADAVESNYSSQAVEKYFGFDPINMPGGGEWTLDFSGFYAGISVSVFF